MSTFTQNLSETYNINDVNIYTGSLFQGVLFGQSLWGGPYLAFTKAINHSPLIDAITINETSVKSLLKTALSETFSVLEAFAKSTNKSLSEVISLVDSLTRSPNHAALDTLTLVDSVAKLATHGLVDTLTLLDSITKTPNKLLTEVLTLVDSLSIGQTLLRTYTDTISLIDSVLKTPNRLLTDVVTLADILTIAQALLRTYTDAISLVDSLSIGQALLRTYTDVLSFIDSVVKTPNKLLTENLSLLDISSMLSAFFFTETISVIESKSNTANKLISNSISLGDLLIRSTNHLLSDLTTLVDQVTNKNKVSVLQDAFSLVDLTITKAAQSIKNDFTSIFEIYAGGGANFVIGISDTIAFIDSIVNSPSKALQELFNLIETKNQSLTHALADILSLAEESTQGGIVFDLFNISELLSFSFPMYNKILLDVITLIETFTIIKDNVPAETQTCYTLQRSGNIQNRNTPGFSWGAPVSTGITSAFNYGKRANIDADTFILVGPASVVVFTSTGSYKVYPPDTSEAILDAFNQDLDYTVLLTSDQMLYKMPPFDPIRDTDYTSASITLSLYSDSAYGHMQVSSPITGVNRVICLYGSEGMILLLIDPNFAVVSTLILNQNLYGGNNVDFVRMSGVSDLNNGLILIGTTDNNGNDFEMEYSLTQRQIIGTRNSAQIRNQIVTTGELLMFQANSIYALALSPPSLAIQEIPALWRTVLFKTNLFRGTRTTTSNYNITITGSFGLDYTTTVTFNSPCISVLSATVQNTTNILVTIAVTSNIKAGTYISLVIQKDSNNNIVNYLGGQLSITKIAP